MSEENNINLSSYEIDFDKVNDLIKFWVKLCSYDRRLALKKLREGRDVNNKILNQKPKTL